MNINEYLNKKKQFVFLLIKVEEKNNNYDEIIDIFSASLVKPFVYEEEGYVVMLSEESPIDLEQLVNAVEEDFGVKLKVYHSNKIDARKIEDFNILKEIYKKHEEKIIANYVSNRVLLSTILEKDMLDLDKVKPIILNKIYNDNKLYEIINGMFVNNLNVCKTANYVYMHRNTINNKLAVIKEETGLDIQNFQDAVLLYVLIKK